MSWPVTLGIAAFALVWSAFFSGCETGYMSVSRARLRRAGGLTTPRGRRLAWQVRSVEDPILTCLIGTNLFNVLGSAVVTAALAARYGVRGEWLAMVLVSTLVIVFGEIVPKVLFREFPERLMLAALPIMRGAMVVAAPVRWLLRGYTALWNLLLPRSDERGRLDRRSLAALLLSNSVPASDDRRFAVTLERFLRLEEQAVVGLARPLDRLATVSPGATVAECLELAARSGFSRLPIRAAGRLSYYVHIRDLLLLPRGERGQPVPRGLWRPLLVVDGRLSPYELFEDLRSQGRQLAVVADADGNPVGLLTLEDLIETVVGSIADEFDPPPAVTAGSDERTDHD